MNRAALSESTALWSRHDLEWRDPAQVLSQWHAADQPPQSVFKYTTRGPWWDVLKKCRITLLVTREYEHLVAAIGVQNDLPALSYLPLPHPSGLVVDRKRHIVHIASTRNPNQVYDFAPVQNLLTRVETKQTHFPAGVLMPFRSRILPGCFYIHDLALVGDHLYATAVGQNAVIRLYSDGAYEREWWPRSIEREGKPDFRTNYLQLNSIAAGSDLRSSFYSASVERPSRRRPGHINWAVDRKGVIFSGSTREPVVRGLTRPHSARLHQGRLWIDNSGYGELVRVDDGHCTTVARLSGWTRGLCFYKDIAFVGTSRVIPKYQRYAPGLKVQESECGIHAVDIRTGQTLASLLWPGGNQLFAIDWAPSNLITGFPFYRGSRRSMREEKKFFYAFSLKTHQPRTENLQ